MPTSSHATTAPRLDLDGPGYARDPIGELRRLRELSSVVVSDRGFELIGYTVAQAAVRDRRMDADHMELVRRLGMPEGPALEYKKRMILSTFGQQHLKLRAPWAPYFGPKQAEALSGTIRAIVDRLLDEVDPHRSVNLFDAVCNRIPAELYCHWVGAPRSDAPFVMRLSDQVLRIFRNDASLVDDIVAGYGELIPYVEARIAERRDDLGDDFLSHLIRQQMEGRLTEQELVDEGVTLLEASTDNTAHQMALVLGLLLETPARWRMLVEDPALVPAAVEEAIRVNPRTLAYDRYAREDLDVDGVRIPKNSRVVVNVQAAQRDPQVFADPDRYDPRRGGPGPLMFGGGVYACLGASVARLEIRTLLLALIERFPQLRLAGDFRPVRNPFTAEVPDLPVLLSPES
jgi:cytochrome P450